ncbi:hypothetical protein E0F15_10980 [Frankia sp. B2]|uniref:hypothetical protein n=1 Tax=Frankia sp. B2 TaxID=2541730 RepID=UPI0010692AEF|nr:hypothetical protein [Frankia sp. B2]TFE31003.1 hypothetical protein E0F15_10980 [Frankia sp. B2]
MTAALNHTSRPGQNDQIKAQHETRSRSLVAALLNGNIAGATRIVAELGPILEVSPYLIFFPERPLPSVPMVGLVRDGRGTVRSGMRDGWYFGGHREHRHWSRLQPEFSGSRFENCCRFWVWCYERLEAWGVPTFRLEDLYAPSEERERFCAELGIQPFKGTLPRRNRDLAGKIRFRALGVEQTRDFSEWSPAEQKAFREIAGPTMDNFYPGWRRAEPPG